MNIPPILAERRVATLRVSEIFVQNRILCKVQGRLTDLFVDNL